MVIGLHHVGRTVADLDATAHDLAVITGWPVTRHGADDPFVAGRSVAATARAHGPNGWIELVAVGGAPAGRRPVNEAGLTHAAVQVGRIEDVVARLDESGIDRHHGPVELGTGFKYLYVRDAEHLVTEVEGAPHAPAEYDAWLAHGAIATPDIDALRAAYENLLGASATNTVRVRDFEVFDRAADLDDVDVTATWVPAGNVAVEMWQYHHPPTGTNPRRSYEAAGAGHLAFETDDVDAEIERGMAAGFTPADDPVTTDGLEVARMLDPDGNWVELLRFDDPDDERSLRQRPDLDRAARVNTRHRRTRS